ncbi:MAG TPA: response regulator transcription factor [Acidimicrobiales bacterium]|jgi:DNA-binding response OmpR family regulator
MSSATGATPRVLAVDDDSAVLDMLRRVLATEGFHVEGATSARAALDVVSSRPPDVVLLDVMLAGDDGLEVLTELRRICDVPVILVTAKGDEADRVLGLRMGADDYVVKPFSYPELVARIGSVLRRTTPKSEKQPLSFGPLTVDTATREVHLNGEAVDTTAKEFDLLAFLAESPRQVFSRQQLLENVWSSSSEWQDPATVTEHVRRLRLKLESEPERPRWILTVRGVGYRFEP